MCGIVGTVGCSNVSIELAANMLSHRGPDDKQYYVDNEVQLGFLRLSIIDLAYGGQPMFNEDGTMILVFNGEIYNHAKLRKELETAGHRFHSDHSDSEVIVHAFEQYGPSCVNHLVGMFAFAIWDVRKRALFAARDRIGIKPFYYTVKEKGGFAFASEIKALLLDHKPEVDLEMLHCAFNNSHGSIGRNTCFRGVYRLLPGHWLMWQQGKVRVQRYWSIPRAEVYSNSDDDIWAKRVRDALKVSVERRMISDVPVGAALSGGLDSSAVVALMSRMSPRAIRTFTAVYGPNDTDGEHARRIADEFKCAHSELVVRPNDVAEILPRVVWHMGEPMGSTGHIALFMLFKEAAQHVRVLLVGEGADELFAGYNRYKTFSPWVPLPRKVKKDIYEYVHWRRPPSSAFSKALVNLKWRDGALGVVPWRDNASFAPSNGARDSITPSADMLNEALWIDLQGQMVNWQMTAVDALSMAHGVEARVPYLDHELVELAMHIPGRLKCYGRKFQDKYILRRAVAPLLPKIVTERAKFPLQLSISAEFSKCLEGLAGDLFTPANVKARGFFSVAEIDRLRSRQNHVYSRQQANALWNLLLIETWARTFLDRPVIESIPGALNSVSA